MCGFVIVDESKACATSATKVCLEAESHHTGLVRFVQGRELFRQCLLGDIWSRRMEDVDDHLAPL